MKPYEKPVIYHHRGTDYSEAHLKDFEYMRKELTRTYNENYANKRVERAKLLIRREAGKSKRIKPSSKYGKGYWQN